MVSMKLNDIENREDGIREGTQGREGTYLSRGSRKSTLANMERSGVRSMKKTDVEY